MATYGDLGRVELNEELIREIADAEMVAIDTETTGLGFDDRIVGIGLAWRGSEEDWGDRLAAGAAYFNMGHPPSLFYPQHNEELVQDAVRAALQADRVFMHNAGFDLERLARWGYGPTGLWPSDSAMVCTQVGSRLVFPFARKESASLAHLSDRFLGGMSGEAAKMKAKRDKLWKLPAEAVDPYGKEDAVMTLLLGERILREADKVYDDEVRTYLFEREGAFVKLLGRMQLMGVMLNERMVKDTLTGLQDDIAARKAALAKHGITGPFNRTQILNALGPDAELLPRTGKGNIRLDAENLQLIGHPIANDVVAWRSLEKAKSTWLEGYLDLVAEDGRLHPRFGSGGTISGRLSCSNPNLQAVPLEDRGYAFGGMTGLFTVPEGRTLLAFDYKQAEMRLASAYAGSTRMARTFNRGDDVHTATAQAMWDQQEIDKAQRQKGKGCNFTLMYGGGIRALNESLGVDPAEAKDLLDRHRAAYPRLNRTNRDVMDVWKKRGWIKLLSGRKRWLGEFEQAYAGFNQLIQGGVAEIIKSAMLAVDALLQETGAGDLLLQVHDSLEAEIAEDRAEEVSPAIEELMQAAMPEWLSDKTDPPIRMGVDREVWA